MAKKTYKKYDKSSENLETFLKQIDEELYFHLLCGYLAPNYDSGRQEDGVTYGQNGECDREDSSGTRFYITVMSVGNKFYYLGSMPSMNKNVYRCEECRTYL